MTVEEDIVRISKKLESFVASGSEDYAVAYDMLRSLAEHKITISVLQKTRIGMTVNNFRKKCSNPEASSLAKKLIRQWKRLIPEQKEVKSDSSQEQISTPDANSEKSSKNGESSDSNISSGSAGQAPPISPGFSQGDVTANLTGDPIRLKCRDMLAKALRTPPVLEGCDPETFLLLSQQTEEAIYQHFKNTNMKYRNRVRSRISNLKDSRNPELRTNVLLGNISASRLALMSAEEMASSEMQKLREKLTREAIDDHQMSSSAGTATTLLKCNKCGKRNVMYNQAQTRSADEPMTTFCFCQECGNRWKFC